MPAPTPAPAPASASEAEHGGAELLRARLRAQPHARAVLAPALAAGASHAYLFHGPAGAGKRAVARAFAAALLADGARNPRTVGERVARDSHPDLTWVRPSGASEMLVADIDQPVVAAATRTPFESARRVFVIEGAETMNDQAANRLLKTIEEPPAFTHLLLLADRREDVLPTIASRCQHVRFDPLPAAAIAERLLHASDERESASGDDDVAHALPADTPRALSPDTAQACARLALGDARLARRLAGDDGALLRECARDLLGGAIAGADERRPWLGMLEAARSAGLVAGERARERLQQDLELLPRKERKRYEREGADAQRRAERRERTRALDLALRLAELWLRDLLCIREGAPELVYAVDRLDELHAHAAATHDALALRRAVELLADTRLSLALNV